MQQQLVYKWFGNLYRLSMVYA